MKKLYESLLFIFSVLFFSTFIRAQSIQVHNMIGKKQNDVIKTFGNPVHKDNTNPEMLCMYYKTNNSTMIFVANTAGVYQAEATKTLDTESSARNEINLFISNSIENGYSVDTVTTSDFHLLKKGVKVDLQVSDNKLSNKFDIRVKAVKTED